jgi:hypothetical protein
MLAIEFLQFGAFFTVWVIAIRWLAGKLRNTGIGPALAYISH